MLQVSDMDVGRCWSLCRYMFPCYRGDLLRVTHSVCCFIEKVDWERCCQGVDACIKLEEGSCKPRQRDQSSHLKQGLKIFTCDISNPLHIGCCNL